MYALVPLFHRGAFEAAFIEPNCLYKTPPFGLAYAAAAAAARMLPGHSKKSRFELTFQFVAAAQRHLVAGSSGDLESAQAYMLLLDATALAGKQAHTIPLLRRAVKLSERLVRALPPGIPEDADAWIYAESVTRLRLAVCAFDQNASDASGMPCFGTHYHAHGPRLLPSGERWFDRPDWTSAFAELQGMWKAHSPMVMFSEAAVAGLALYARSVAAYAYSGYGSALCHLELANFAENLLLIVKRAPAGSRKQLAASLSAITDSILQALPEDLRSSFLAGDSGPFYSTWERIYPSYAHVRVCVQLLLVHEGCVMDRLAIAGFEGAALARALWFASFLKGVVRQDRIMEGMYYLLAPPAFKAGLQLLGGIDTRSELIGEAPEDAALRLARSDECRKGIELIGALLVGLGKKFGMSIAGMAPAFAAICAERGVHVAVPAPGADWELPESLVGEDGSEGRAGFYWDAVAL
ncbi:hypothetical protein DFJ74DRAFT_663977 [Hyaloraphidium curvatum]|nr:hypothetical protein DFJ74DRAFT_663977 [Hyaloraphidium curvatum]